MFVISKVPYQLAERGIVQSIGASLCTSQGGLVVVVEPKLSMPQESKHTIYPNIAIRRTCECAIYNLAFACDSCASASS